MRAEKIKFLRRIIVFIMVLIVLIFGINWLYKDFLLSQSVKHRQGKDYQSYIDSLEKKEINFAIFGDSHAATAVNPEFFPGSYNLAHTGERYFSTYYSFKNMLDSGVEVSTVILEIDNHSFAQSWENTFADRFKLDAWFYSDFVSYFAVVKRFPNDWPAIWIKSIIPFVGAGEDALRISKMEVKLGWIKHNKDLSITGKLEKGKPPTKDHAKTNNSLLVDFQKVLKLANENNIQIALVRYPIYRGYDEYKTDPNTWDQYYREVFNAVEEVVGDDYSELNYYDLFNNYPEYFSDVSHLNSTGAEVFTKQIYQDLVK